MRHESRENKNLIYDLMNGVLVLDQLEESKKLEVKDEFLPDSYCSKLYEEVYQAKVALCKRLNVQEDNEIETIISNLMDIGKYLSMKMFDYGMEEGWKKNTI